MLFLFPGFKQVDFLTFTLDYHLGTSYILAYLREKGINAAQFIYRQPIDLYTLTDKILKERPKIVGLTCYDTSYYFVKLISQLLKKKEPKLTIVVGGPTATFSDRLIMKDNPSIDICVRGEGEYTVYELLKRLRANQEINDVEGITYRVRRKIAQTPDRSFIKGEKKNEDLDILPSPYLNHTFPVNENLGILTSRGCIFKCTYCNFSAMSRWTVRYHSVERVIAELKMIDRQFQSKGKNTENKLVHIYDDAFSLNIERAKRLCRRIIEEKLDLRFWAETRADRVDKELLTLMRQAGFREINFGLESASPKILKITKKVRYDHVNANNLIPEKKYIEKVKQNVKAAKEIGLNPTVSVIMGLPGATIKDDRKTIGFIRQLKIRGWYYNYLRIFPGTELFKTHKRYSLGIKRSLTVLPYQTEYAYEEHEIPEIESAIFQRFIRENTIEQLMKLISGDYGNMQGDGYPGLLLGSGLLNDKTIQWIKHSIAISPVICFVNGYYTDGFFQQNMKKMIYSGLPVSNFYLLTSLNDNDINTNEASFESGRYEVTVATEILSSKRKKFLKLTSLDYIPFANYAHRPSILSDMKNKGINKVVFTLATFEDIKKLLGMTFDDPDKIILKGNTANLDCYFLDECRWSDVDCPAVNFRRAIIEKDGLIIPCFNSKPIARIRDDRKRIVKNLKLLWDDMKEKRGCKNCLVKENCSKCLFPYPMNDKEYCEVRRKWYSNIASANNIFKIYKNIRKRNSFIKNERSVS